MTNAQWMLENGMDFNRINIKPDPNCLPLENLDRTKHYISGVITWETIVLTTFEAEDDKFAILHKGIKVLFDWLDKEHKEILTDDEKFVLKESIKPYRNRVINIHKTLRSDDNSVCFISVLYNTDDQKPKTWSVDDAQIYMVKIGEGLQFAGMTPCVDYTVEELNLGEEGI